MSGGDYQVRIAMSAATVTALSGDGYCLYGFKAVQCADRAGRPLVWYKTNAYSPSTTVAWSEQYRAYTSTSPIANGGQVVLGSSYPIGLGQTLSVAANGIGTVLDGGPPQAISIRNTTGSPYTCGIAQPAAGASSPLCALPLYGNNLDVVAPLAKVLLMFSTQPLAPGTVVGPPPGAPRLESYSPTILIDLTSANQRDVCFDVDAGWSWGGFAWAQSCPAGSNMVPLLIETVAAGFRRRARVLRS